MCGRGESAGRIRVLLLVPRFGTIRRGVEQFAYELARRMDRSRIGLTIASAPHGEKMKGVDFVRRRTLLRENGKRFFENSLSRAGLRLMHVHNPAELEAFLFVANSLRDVWRSRFDVVLPSGGSWTYALARVHRLRGAAVVSVGHAGPTPFDLKSSDIFVGLTPSSVEEAKRLRPGMPVRQIPNGVDTEVFKPSGEQRERGTTVILTVGALSREKRHDLLFDAVLHLPPSVHVRCVGEGPERARLAEHQLCRAGRVTFETRPHADMPACYRDADLFSLASPQEPFGIVFLEALASGLNVVAHNDEPQRFVLGDVGFYCDVHDPAQYAGAIVRALSARQVERNIAHAAQFDWNSIVRRYEDLFAEMVAVKQDKRRCDLAT